MGVLFRTKDRLLAYDVHGRPMEGRIAGMIYEEIKDAGHMIPVTQPKTVAAFIEKIAARMAEAA